MQCCLDFSFRNCSEQRNDYYHWGTSAKWVFAFVAVLGQLITVHQTLMYPCTVIKTIAGRGRSQPFSAVKTTSKFDSVSCGCEAHKCLLIILTNGAMWQPGLDNKRGRMIWVLWKLAALMCDKSTGLSLNNKKHKLRLCWDKCTDDFHVHVQV